MDAVVCCIALNEHKYINEWINYHLKLGFSNIYIYDNSNDNNMYYLHNNDNIIVLHLPGRRRQYNAYIHFFMTFGKYHKWCAVLDCDEFIVLHKHKNIVDFLQQYLQNGALSINLYIFGSNGHKTYTENLVLERFTKREKNVNKHIKYIVCCENFAGCYNPHFPLLNNGTVIKDVHGNIVSGPFNELDDNSICQINHYFGKSYEEYLIKQKRGCADNDYIRSISEFYDNDLNEIEDLTALNFYNEGIN